eukprot:scaffold7190_cov193-Amphora_coffeaeformis.AAC.1
MQRLKGARCEGVDTLYDANEFLQWQFTSNRIQGWSCGPFRNITQINCSMGSLNWNLILLFTQLLVLYVFAEPSKVPVSFSATRTHDFFTIARDAIHFAQ